MMQDKRCEPEFSESRVSESRVSESRDSLAQSIRSLAQTHQGESLELLALLRMLESLHQEIREGLFQESLPDNRQALYALLKDIETSGGWPYIHRMRLQSLLERLQTTSDAALVATLTGLPPGANADSLLDFGKD